MEGTIWAAMDNLSKALYKVFHSLLKCSTEVRHLTLQWLGSCLYTNAGRGKLWNSQVEMGLLGRTCVSDGFMLNIGNVLLRLCQPFCAKLNDAKVPKIDPTYCSTEVGFSIVYESVSLSSLAFVIV
jgi:ubiquitin conjugation factor E4 A